MAPTSAARSHDGRPLAELVRAWRERAFLTQQQLAERAGLAVRTIRRLESGRQPKPRAGSLRLLTDALQLTPAERTQLITAAHQPDTTRPPAAGPLPGQQPADIPIPRQLPIPPPLFTGRAPELAELQRAADPAAVVITAIDGMAGIGKTALAVHAAHRIADRYPDGQLFIDLHGHTQGLEPIEPGQALDHLLRALGIAGTQIPASLEERAALYRTRLAGRQMVIVLDNVATETQVQPLLPGTPGCLVLVTSRRQLAGLDRTRTLSLDTLPLPDAVALFTHTAGEGRLTGQLPELVSEAVLRCGRLPLAIRIAAARLRSHPAWDLAHLVERLRDRGHRLGELNAGQRSVTAALDLSYQHVNPEQRRAYRLLGLHPGPHIDPYATAALLGSTPFHARLLLDQLLDAHLLQEPTPGRYVFHDLIRAHAVHTAARDETEAGQHRALSRLFDYYRHTAAAAMDAAYPFERRPPVPPAPTPIPDLPGPAPALRWLDTELPNLLAAARHAGEHAWPAHLLHLSAVLHRHVRVRGHYRDAGTLLRQSAAVARSTGNQAAELAALVGLGDVHWRQGRYERATDDYQRALRIAGRIGDRAGEPSALVGLGHVHRLQGRHQQAADHYRQALRIASTTGDRAGELDSLVALGHVHQRQGRYQPAADHFERALRVARSIDDRVGELNTLTGLGDIHRRQGRPEQAADYYRQALRIAGTTGDSAGRLNALGGMAQIHRRWGQHEPAADRYRQMLRIARTIGNRVGELRALTGLGTIDRLRGRYGKAADHYRRLLDLARATGDRNRQFEAQQGLGLLHHAIGDPHAAIAHHVQALALADELSQPADQARAHNGLAHAHRTLNQHEQADLHWQRALQILTGLGVDHTDEEETTAAAIRTNLVRRDRQPPTRSRSPSPPTAPG